MKKDIKENVSKIICKQLDVESIKETDYLLRDLGGDSLDMVEIYLELEDAFNIDIKEEEWKEWKTVKNVIRCVELKLNH
jgi:acyl carrier protein